MLTRHDYESMTDGQRQILLEGAKLGRKQVRDFLIRKSAKLTPSERSVIVGLLEELDKNTFGRIF